MWQIGVAVHLFFIEISNIPVDFVWALQARLLENVKQSTPNRSARLRKQTPLLWVNRKNFWLTFNTIEYIRMMTWKQKTKTPCTACTVRWSSPLCSHEKKAFNFTFSNNSKEPKRRNEDSKTLKMSTRARPTDQPDLESQHHFFGWTERTFDFRHNWIYPHEELKQITDPPVQPNEAHPCAVMKKKLSISLFQTTPKRRNEDFKTLKMSTTARPTDQPDLESQHDFFGWTELTFDFRHKWIYPHDDLKHMTDPLYSVVKLTPVQ